MKLRNLALRTKILTNTSIKTGSASPYNLLGRPSNTKYFSQDRQDQYVDQYFGKTNNGIFLEVGAADGVTLSNTLFLERERNWTGLLIEPDTSFL